MTTDRERALARDRARKRRSRTPEVFENLEDLIAIFADEIPVSLDRIILMVEAEQAHARDKFDTRRQLALGRLSHELTKLQQALMRAERKVRDARNGEYRDRTIDEDE